MKSKQLKNIITKLLTQPTAPFRESWVSASIKEICEHYELPFIEDPYGNLWVNAKSEKDIKAAPLVAVAHMDHPGMVIQKFSKKNNKLIANAKWLGGGPLDIKGQKVKIFSDEQSLVTFNGQIISHTLQGTRGPDQVEIEIDVDTPASEVMRSAVREYGDLSQISKKILTPKGFKMFGPWGACLWYNDVPQAVKFTNNECITKAADDLIGVAAILEAIIEAVKYDYSTKAVCLFSKAEESGFHGTLYALKNKLLNPEKTAVLSVETSSRLPGALPGGGPVIRLGDKMTVFNPSFVYWLETVAKNLKDKRKVDFQKRLMDGGTCEASAFNAFGFKVAGLSTPLVNYHNQFLPAELLENKKFKENPKKAYPEKVNLHDVQGLAHILEHCFLIFNSKTFEKINEQAFSKTKLKLIEHHNLETKLYFE